MSTPHHFAGCMSAAYFALQAYDVDPVKVFTEAGLDVASMSDPSYRLHIRDYMPVWRKCIEATGDPNFVLRCVDFIQPTGFHAFGLALFASRTLRSFCQRYAMHNSFLTSSYGIEFDESPLHPVLFHRCDGLLNDSEEDTKFLLSSTLAWILQMMRLIYTRSFHPVEVSFAAPRSELDASYEEYFRCPITYNAERYSMSFMAKDLDAPLATGNTEIALQNDEVVVKFLSRIDRENTRNRVFAALLELFPTGEVSKEKVARTLGLSVRTLQNRLSAEGVTFQDILDETRQNLAKQYLGLRQYAVGDVAFLVGFSDFSNFSRAFKRWTGESPSEFRKNVLGK